MNQIRLSPMGRVIGLDLTAGHEVTRARGFNLAIVSELLQAAEGGLLEALNENTETGSQPSF